jgi:hypothetical protein
MRNLTPLRLLALLFSLGLLVAACGGDDGGGDEESFDDPSQPAEDDDDATTTTEPPATTEAEEERSDAIEDFRVEVEDELEDVPTSTTSYGEYVSVTDDSGFLTVEVPAAWSDVDGSPGLFGPDVTASTDVEAFFSTYDVPGVEFQATDAAPDETPEQVLDSVTSLYRDQCTPSAVEPYADPLYTGVSQVLQDCAGTTTDFVWVAMEPADGSFHGVVGIQVLTEADLEALERILNTFIVNV